ncbi:MAG: hypothetical protein JST26_13640 [Bacteroidetes bacterium]|nr:hypothetical protein [Bacteroidota bacterium]
MNQRAKYSAVFSRKGLMAILLCTAIVLTSASCRTHKDCRGRRKVAQTQMGGWL